MLQRFRNTFCYFDTHPGMPIAVVTTTFLGLVVLRLNQVLHFRNTTMFLALLLFVFGAIMLGTLGWMLTRTIATIRNETDDLRLLLGMDSWVAVYEIEGQQVKGSVEMSLDEALDFAERSKGGAGAYKTQGVRRRYVWLGDE